MAKKINYTADLIALEKFFTLRKKMRNGMPIILLTHKDAANK